MNAARKSALWSLTLRLFSVSTMALLLAGGQPAAAQTFTNPLGTEADPKILYQGGKYYTVQGDLSHLFVFQSSSLATILTDAAPTIITNSGDTRTWAPEIHYINGEFYIYAAVDAGIRVLESSDGTTWTNKSILGSGAWIDPSILQLSDGSLYLLFSNYPSISIIAMSDPWTTSGSSTQLSSPTYSWEGNVNENPNAIVHNNTVYVTYSANAWNTGNYAVGQLSAPVSSNLLNAGSYTKSANAVFASSSTTGVYGPGGQCFFKSPDGTEDWLCYHAYAASNGLAGGYPRTLRAQKFTWNSDGSPNLGTPVAAGAPITLPAGDTGASQQNFALGATPYASSQYSSDYAASKAIDGSINASDSGGWSPSGSDAQPWFEIDMAQPRLMTSVELVTRQGADQPATRRNFQLWASNVADMSTHVVLGERGSDGIAYQGTGSVAVTGSQTYRYLAAVKTVPEYFFIAELRALGGGAPVTDLARAGTASASSEYDNTYRAGFANDGEYLGGWSASGSDTQPWWQVDLGTAQALGKIDVTPRIDADQAATRRSFEIWASNSADMSSHVVLGSVDANGIAYGSTYSVSPTDMTPYRYVRVRKTVTEYLFLSEVKVYAK